MRIHPGPKGDRGEHYLFVRIPGRKREIGYINCHVCFGGVLKYQVFADPVKKFPKFETLEEAQDLVREAVRKHGDAFRCKHRSHPFGEPATPRPTFWGWMMLFLAGFSYLTGYAIELFRDGPAEEAAVSLTFSAVEITNGLGLSCLILASLLFWWGRISLRHWKSPMEKALLELESGSSRERSSEATA